MHTYKQAAIDEAKVRLEVCSDVYIRWAVHTVTLFTSRYKSGK